MQRLKHIGPSLSRSVICVMPVSLLVVSGAFLLQILPHAGKETVSRERHAAAKESRANGDRRFDKHGLT